MRKVGPASAARATVGSSQGAMTANCKISRRERSIVYLVNTCRALLAADADGSAFVEPWLSEAGLMAVFAIVEFVDAERDQQAAPKRGKARVPMRSGARQTDLERLADPPLGQHQG